MHPRLLLAGAAVTAGAMLVPTASAAPSRTALVITDPAGDANLSGVHGQSAPGSQPSLDITSVTWDTVKKKTTTVVRRKRVTKLTPTHLLVTMKLGAAPGAVPQSSYAVYAEHPVCGGLLLQVYYSGTDVATYGSFDNCGEETDLGDSFGIDFAPEIKGTEIIVKLTLKALPSQVKVGNKLTGIGAYTSTADPVIGFQPTDFEPDAGYDTVRTDKSWPIG